MFENNSTSIVYTQTCVKLEYIYSLFTLPCQPSSLEKWKSRDESGLRSDDEVAAWPPHTYVQKNETADFELPPSRPSCKIGRINKTSTKYKRFLLYIDI